MSSTPITAELREYVRAVRAYHLTDIHGKKREYVDTTTRELLGIADRIDAEHERRMADMAEVVRCADCAYCQRHVDGSHVCELTHLAHRADYYCYFGARWEVDE